MDPCRQPWQPEQLSMDYGQATKWKNLGSLHEYLGESCPLLRTPCFLLGMSENLTTIILESLSLRCVLATIRCQLDCKPHDIRENAVLVFSWLYSQNPSRGADTPVVLSKCSGMKERTNGWMNECLHTTLELVGIEASYIPLIIL